MAVNAGHLGIRFIYHTSVDVCTPTLLHAKISVQNIKHFVRPVGPNCLVNKFVTASLGVGGGLGPALLIVSAADKGTG